MKNIIGSGPHFSSQQVGEIMSMFFMPQDNVRLARETITLYRIFEMDDFQLIIDILQDAEVGAEIRVIGNVPVFKKVFDSSKEFKEWEVQRH